MAGLLRSLPTPRWRTALRAGVLAAGLAVVVGAPLTAKADDGHGGWRGHEGREHWRGHEWREHEWREHNWGGGYGYYGPRYYAPAYGYYAPSYGYYAPGVTFSIR